MYSTEDYLFEIVITSKVSLLDTLDWLDFLHWGYLEEMLFWKSFPILVIPHREKHFSWLLQKTPLTSYCFPFFVLKPAGLKNLRNVLSTKVTL